MERLTSEELRQLLEQAGPALTNGCANVISVSAIRDGSGVRWPRKREQVGEFVQRAFARATAGHGILASPPAYLSWLSLLPRRLMVE